MNCIEVKANELFDGISVENQRLKQFVNILLEFKQFCDSIVKHLDYNLTSDHSRRYRDLTKKYQLCIDTEVDEENGVSDADEVDPLSKTSLLNLFKSSLNRTSSTVDEAIEDSYQVSGRTHEEAHPILSSKLRTKPISNSHALSLPASNIEVIDLDEDEAVEDEEDEHNGVSNEIRERHSDLSKPYKCDYMDCGQQFANKYQLARHNASHSNDRPFACPVAGCGNRYKRNDHLSVHMKHKHPNVYHVMKETNQFTRPLVCPKCNLRFKYMTSLESHVCSEVPVDEPPESDYIVACDDFELFDSGNPCDVCSEVFDSRDELKAHRMRVHRIVDVDSGERPKVAKPAKHVKQSIDGQCLPRTPRQPTSYWEFAKLNRPIVHNEMNKEMAKYGMVPTMAQVNTELGKRWHQLSDEEKQTFKDLCYRSYDNEDPVVITPIPITHTKTSH